LCGGPAAYRQNDVGIKMDEKLKCSIDRANALIGHGKPIYEHFLSLKITPENTTCCCFHCWPETWHNVNRYIHPYGPLLDEGDVLLGDGEDKFVLQCHESGPEVVLYLGLATASLVLVKSVVELFTVLLKSLQNEKRKTPSKVHLTKRIFVNGEYKEEHIIDIEFPLSETAELELQKRVEELLKKNP
jgi:hypothetical protein